MSVGSLAVEPWSNRTGLKVKTRVQGAGEIILQHKAYRLERMQYVVRLSVMGTDFAIINEPIYPDWSRGDFVNLSLPVNGSAEGIISHIYLNQSSVTSLHVL